MYLEKSLSKENLIECICNKVEELGFNIRRESVVIFLDNFKEKYNRLPKENEIKPIVLSYMKKYKAEHLQEASNQENFNYGILDNEIYLNKKNTISISTPISKYDEEILIFPKPQGRRICPICGPLNHYKIHEIIDKDNLICVYPKIYGKKYICDKCGIEWKEK